MVWVMAPEDGEWRYLFAAAIDDTPDDPEEAFEEPIEDEDDMSLSKSTGNTRVI